MKNLIRLAAVVTVATAACAHAQSALTNDMVAKLVASGMPESAVIGIIQSQPSSYATGPKDLAVLQQSGVSPNEIAAMLQRGSSDNTANQSSQSPAGSSAGLALRDGTPVRLRLTRTLSSGQATVGDKIDFDVLDDVRVGGTVVVPRGTKAIGSITQAEPKKRMGRAGKLNFMLEQVRLSDDTKVTLRATRETSGGGHVGAMTAGIVAASIFIWPAAPLFLMMHGKDAVIPEGTEITAYVDGDVQLNPVVASLK
jgi:hypothetical protein